MGAKMSVLRLVMSFPPYLSSANVRFPFMNDKGVCRTASATPGLLKNETKCIRCVNKLSVATHCYENGNIHPLLFSIFKMFVA